jgi:hypothetical protein
VAAVPIASQTGIKKTKNKKKTEYISLFFLNVVGITYLLFLTCQTASFNAGRNPVE